MARIKILRIIARLNIGGPAIHTVLLTGGLNKNKFESMLISGAISKAEGDMAYYASEKDIKPIYIPHLRREPNLLNDLIAFIKILRIVFKEKPDIIHTHTAKAGTLGRLAGIIYNCAMRLPACRQGRLRSLAFTRNDEVKLVHTFHGHIFDGYFNSFFTRIFTFIEKLLACFTDKIITVSEEVKKELVALKIAKDARIKVIPLGFELEKFLEIPKRDGRETINVGIVGRLVPVKNHRLFLEAAQILRRSLVNETSHFSLKFVIVGDGELRSELQKYAKKLDLDNYVEFRGWQKDLVKVYSELDIVCLTSLNEGTPVSLIEAMASGKTVVATDVGGVIDLLGKDRGIAVESKNIQDFSKAILSLIDNVDLRERMGKAAREFVRKEFSENRLFNDMDELYSNILKAKRL